MGQEREQPKWVAWTSWHPEGWVSKHDVHDHGFDAGVAWADGGHKPVDDVPSDYERGWMDAKASGAADRDV
jgi:hypothetical protein